MKDGENKMSYSHHCESSSCRRPTLNLAEFPLQVPIVLETQYMAHVKQANSLSSVLSYSYTKYKINHI